MSPAQGHRAGQRGGEQGESSPDRRRCATATPTKARPAVSLGRGSAATKADDVYRVNLTYGASSSGAVMRVAMTSSGASCIPARLHRRVSLPAGLRSRRHRRAASRGGGGSRVAVTFAAGQLVGRCDRRHDERDASASPLAFRSFSAAAGSFEIIADRMVGIDVRRGRRPTLKISTRVILPQRGEKLAVDRRKSGDQLGPVVVGTPAAKSSPRSSRR